MDVGDRAAVEAAWKNGVGVLHDLLSQDELDAIRRGIGTGVPGSGHGIG